MADSPEVKQDWDFSGQLIKSVAKSPTPLAAVAATNSFPDWFAHHQCVIAPRRCQFLPKGYFIELSHPRVFGQPIPELILYTLYMLPGKGWFKQLQESAIRTTFIHSYQDFLRTKGWHDTLTAYLLWLEARPDMWTALVKLPELKVWRVNQLDQLAHLVSHQAPALLKAPVELNRFSRTAHYNFRCARHLAVIGLTAVEPLVWEVYVPYSAETGAADQGIYRLSEMDMRLVLNYSKTEGPYFVLPHKK